MVYQLFLNEGVCIVVMFVFVGCVYSFCIFFVTWNLMGACSDRSTLLIAFSASRLSVEIQFLCLRCKLYASPLLRMAISSLE